MKTEGIQSKLMQLFRQRIPSHMAAVDVIAELLGMSADSAYRRMRGETALTLEEADILARHVGISLDGLGSGVSGKVLFEYQETSTGADGIYSLLDQLLADVKRIEQAPEREIVVFAKDVPPFYLYHFPELATYKALFWAKHVLHAPHLAEVKSYHGQVDDVLVQTGRRLLDAYARIPSVEIWDENTTQTLMPQIIYGLDSGLIQDRALAKKLCGQAITLIEYVQAQAEQGIKFRQGKEERLAGAPFRLYLNEMVVGENTFLVKMGESRITFLNQNVLQYLHTDDQAFGESTERFLENVIRHSLPLSGVSQKERSKFFNKLLSKAKSIQDSI